MTEALDRLIGHYPWLVDEDAEDDGHPLPSHPSGRPTGMKKMRPPPPLPPRGSPRKPRAATRTHTGRAA